MLFLDLPLWHREIWDWKLRHFQKEISRENTTRREVIQRTKVTTRLLPQRIQFHKKLTMFFFKATTCFMLAILFLCFSLPFSCLFDPINCSERQFVRVCLTVEPLHRFDLMFRVSFDNCTTCVPSSARTARTKVTDGYRI